MRRRRKRSNGRITYGTWWFYHLLQNIMTKRCIILSFYLFICLQDTGIIQLNSPWLRTAVVGIWKVKQTKCCVRLHSASLWEWMEKTFNHSPNHIFEHEWKKLTVAAGGALPALLTDAGEGVAVHHAGPSILTGTRQAAAVLRWGDKYEY